MGGGQQPKQGVQQPAARRQQRKDAGQRDARLQPRIAMVRIACRGQQGCQGQQGDDGQVFEQ
ncbi:hypothetical protein D3C72_1996530 [compost metagenome]